MAEASGHVRVDQVSRVIARTGMERVIERHESIVVASLRSVSSRRPRPA